jgi:hypothetical protein
MSLTNAALSYMRVKRSNLVQNNSDKKIATTVGLAVTMEKY